MSPDRRNHAGAATELGQSPTGGLAQPMNGGGGGKSSLAALALKPMGERIRVKWPAAVGREKRQMLRRCCLERRLQLGMQQDRQRGAGLTLAHVNKAVAHMLAAHADHIGAALCRVEQERERETGSSSDRMPGLEGGNIVLG